MKAATAFAPGGIGNLGVGFDVLGMALESPGDRVTVTVSDRPGVRIVAVTGVVTDLPRVAEDNTAGAALLALVAEARADFGLDVAIDKGIPLGSGMGGSAASAVGAVVAGNAVLPSPLPEEVLLRCAVRGEAVASGAYHADNVAPCLLGGLTLTGPGEDPWVTRVRAPRGVVAVVVRPDQRLDTRLSRSVLDRTVPLATFVHQSADLARFVAACFTDDLDAIGQCLRDVVVEPKRAPLIPRFAEVQRAAFAAGALGCSIAGAGPSVFAWARQADADRVEAAMVHAFGPGCAAVRSRVDAPGARIVP
jgi:homoserine kinase